MKRTILLLFALSLVGLGACLYAFLNSKKQIVVVSALQEQLAALQKLKATLVVGAVPQGWDAGVYFPYKPINESLAKLTDLKFTPGKDSSMEDVELQVKSFVLGRHTAIGSAEVELEARSLSWNTSVALKGNAQLSFERVSAGKEEGTRIAHFSVWLTDLSPKIGISQVALAFSRDLNALLSAPLLEKINQEINKQLDLGIPFPCPSGIAFNVDETPPPLSAGSANLTVNISMPGKPIPIPIDFNSAVFTKKGVWILVNAFAPAAVISESPHFTTEVELRKAINVLEAELAPTLADVLQSDDNALVWVNGRAVTRFVQNFGKLLETNRTIFVVSTICDGNFVEIKKSYPVLGHTEVSVALPKHDSLRVTAVIQPPRSNWVPKLGVSYSASVTGNTTGDVKFNLNPPIGGPVRPSVGLEGKSDATLSGTAAVRQARIGERTIVYLDPGNDALSLTAGARTKDKFVTDLGWTKVPQFGFTVGLQLPPTVVPSFRLIDDLPLASWSIRKTAKGTGPSLTAEEDLHLEVRLLPQGVDAQADGFLVTSQFAIDLPKKATDMEDVKTQRREIMKAVERQRREANPGSASLNFVRVEPWDIELGPNNDLIGFLLVAGKKAEEIIKALQDFRKTIPISLEDIAANSFSPAFFRSDVGLTMLSPAKPAAAVVEEAKKEMERLIREVMEKGPAAVAAVGKLPEEMRRKLVEEWKNRPSPPSIPPPPERPRIFGIPPPRFPF